MSRDALISSTYLSSHGMRAAVFVASKADWPSIGTPARSVAHMPCGPNVLTGWEMSQLYDISPCDIRSQLSDGYKNVFLLIIFSLLTFLMAVSRSPLVIAACTGAFCGAIPSIWLGLPCKMRIDDRKDARRIEEYLSSAFHVERHNGWIPKLPDYLYFKSQTVRIEDGLVFGPRITILKLRKVLLSTNVA